jgi:hypothetical protein
MARRRLAIGLAGLCAAAVGCSGSTTTPSTAGGTTATLRGEVSDPAGDAIADPRIPISPDLVHATAEVAGGNLTIVIQFAPGTLNRQTTRVSVLLDTDQDGTTGIREANGLGADYSLDFSAGIAQATVTKADVAACAARQSCFNPVGSVSINFLTDAMQAVVPLAMLGNDDGRMNFSMSSYVLVAPLTAVVVDFMPDATLPPGRIQ